MKAPEKIYVPMSRYWYGIDSLFYPVRQHKNDTEYIRTDAFIEKACEWIKDNGSHYIDIVNGQLILKKSIIKDFRTYMEGE